MDSNIYNITNDQKNIIISLITGVFIYYRKLDYYKTLPKKSYCVSMSIIIWTYLAIKDPIWIIVGLVLLNLFGHKHENI